MPPTKYITLLFIGLLSILAPSAVSGHDTVNTEDIHVGGISMSQWPASETISRHEHARATKSVRKQQRKEKFVARIQKAIQAKWLKKHPGGISDPVDKWFWIWTMSWGLGIILTIIAGGAIASAALGIVWLSSFVIGSVALILWLVKKFGQ